MNLEWLVQWPLGEVGLKHLEFVAFHCRFASVRCAEWLVAFWRRLKVVMMKMRIVGGMARRVVDRLGSFRLI